MTNKQIIERLIKHFMQAEKEVIARALANQIIDFHRLHIIDSLPEEERECFLERMKANERQFLDFVTNGPRRKFGVFVSSTVEEVREKEKELMEEMVNRDDP